ncbi:MAG: CDP-diacylglycerol--glycerol-3-phosphate 3-phosphatidyltransferase [Anaerovoracaceae bacterium]|nr:CDP-diacylglycerol--glycerol-3-phosphate 3-phosphatidyltransferase [Clostridiales bacterium]
MNLPNRLTLLRVIMVPFFIVFYLKGYFLISFVLFVLASLTDLLDGHIARKRNLISNFGKIMDPLADKILVYSAFCLMVGNGLVPAWMLIVILVREFAVSGMRTVAASEGIVVAADLSGKIKTVLQMIAVPMLILTGVILSDIWFTLSMAMLWASLIMTVYSGIQYIYKNRKVFSL